MAMGASQMLGGAEPVLQCAQALQVCAPSAAGVSADVASSITACEPGDAA